MKQKKLLLWIALGMLLISAAAFALWPRSGDTLQEGNLICDPDFAAVHDAGGWYYDAYIQTVGYTDYSAQDGVATITNHALNDARFAQDVSVQPDSYYCLSGWICADASEGLGANLSIADVYVFSECLYDTEGEWQQVRLYGRTGENQRSVTIFARLGGYSGEAIGTASFRDITLEQVSEVPSDYFTYNWYKTEATTATETTYSGAAWPYLMLIALLYAAVCCLLRTKAQQNNAEMMKHGWLIMAAVLLAAFVTRLIVAVLVPGYGVDVGCFTAWADMMANTGASQFYLQGAFCDYPPGYILVLGLIGTIGKWLGTGATELLIKLPSIVCDIAAAAVLYGFACKRTNERAALTMAALYAFNPLTYIAGAAWGQADSVMALCILLVVVLASDNKWWAALPVYMLSVLMKPQALMFGPLGLCALIIALIRRHDRAMIRQVIIGLVSALATGLLVVLPFAIHQEPTWIFELYAGTMGYYASVTVNACNLYFLLGKNWLDVDQAAPVLIRLLGMLCLVGGCAFAAVRCKWYRKSTGYISVMSAAAAACLLLTVIPMTYQMFGVCVIVVAVAICVAMYIKGGDIRHLALLGAAMLIMLCNIGTMMHERYLFSAVILLALACILEQDKRVYWLFAAVTAVVFLNVGLVLDRGVRIGGVSGHLSAPLFDITSESAALEYGLSFVNCLLTAWCGYISLMICCEGRTVPIASSAAASCEEETGAPAFNRAEDSLDHPRHIPPMKGLDWLLMLGITAVYAVVALTNLGSTKSPQTYWRSQTADETVMLDLGEVRDMNMLYLGGIHSIDSDFVVQVSEDGVNWSEPLWAKMQEGDCFKWQYLCIANESYEGLSYTSTPRTITARYIQIQARMFGTTLYEVILRDPDTQKVFPVTALTANAAELVDEQDTFTGEPGWYNSTYFDEIYHARTAYEHYMAMQGDYTYHPYETSHPPLGKVLMAFSIAIFGMTPFGWRFAGALAGILMLPGIYLMAKMLLKRRWGAFAATFLLAVDCMHFSQTRIATIDSFVVLFIIWSYVFMIYYITMDYWHTKLWKTMIPLALSGLFMGLGVASKWTGCYAGVGLALLFFWSLWRRWNEYRYAREKLNAFDARTSKKERRNRAPLENETLLRAVNKEGIIRPVSTLLSCLVFFIAVPLLIYYASYIPYFLPSGGITVKRVIQAAVGDYFTTGNVGGMLGYHGTPGLGMDHPFYSPWYEWPVIGKPMWYFSSSYRTPGYTQNITAMGNPAVWWGGLAGLAGVMLIWALRHITRRGFVLNSEKNDMRPAILLIAFAAQYIPWTLVPRGTYIYHYFPAVPFIILSAVLCLDVLADQQDKLCSRIQCIEQPGKALRLAGRFNWVLCFTVIYLVLALGLFIAFFPYASGITASTKWFKAMQWFNGWLYY